MPVGIGAFGGGSSACRAGAGVNVPVVRIFRRDRQADSGRLDDEASLEEMESNPELLAAEAAVDRLPPPRPSSNTILEVFMGPRPRIVGEVEDEDPPGR